MNTIDLNISNTTEAEDVRPLSDHEIEFVSGAGYDWLSPPSEDWPWVTYEYEWN